MPDALVGWAAMAVALVLAVIAVAQRAALAKVNQINVSTDSTAVENERERARIQRDILLDRIAATSLKNAEDFADARVASADAKGAATLALSKIETLTENNTHLEAANFRLEQRINDNDGAYKAQIIGLNAQITRQNKLIDGFPNLIAALRAEIAVKANPGATAEQVAEAEKASADATAATLSNNSEASDKETPANELISPPKD